MTAMGLTLLVTGLTFLVVGAWYLRANRTWTRLLAAEDPRLAYDPVRDPLGWARGGTYRVSTWLTRLRVPDGTPEVERWRVRTLNRLAVCIGACAFAFIAGGTLVGHTATFAQASVERYGSGFGILLDAVAGFVLFYYTAQLGRSLFEFGNGRRPAGIELAVAVAGISAVLIGMAIMPSLDLSKP